MNCLIDLIGCGAAIVALMALCNDCIYGKKEKDEKKKKKIKNIERMIANVDHNASPRFARVSQGISIPKERIAYRNSKRSAEYSGRYEDHFSRSW